MKRLLVASDLSHRSERAVAQALFLARRFDVPCVVLHVVDDELPSTMFMAAQEQAMANLRETVERLVGKDGTRCEVRVVGGLDFQAIVDLAEAEDASLIVLGAHRRNLLKDVFTGTTVERVIRNTTRPVLVVKRPAPGNYVCTLAAVDLIKEAVEVVQWGHQLAHGQTLYLVHVLSDAADMGLPAAGLPAEQVKEHTRAVKATSRALLGELTTRAGLTAEAYLPVVEKGVAVPQILKTVQTLLVELGVVGTRTHVKGTAERFLLGSVAEELLRDMPCDVLAVPLPGSNELPGAAAVTTFG